MNQTDQQAATVLIRVFRPEGYEDVSDEILLSDLDIHPDFKAEVATPPAADAGAVAPFGYVAESQMRDAASGGIVCGPRSEMYGRTVPLYTRPGPSVLDVEAMIAACVPGGSMCDPQTVADNLRQYTAALLGEG